MKDRLEEIHSPSFELLRHFLARNFDSEMFSTRGQWRPVAVSVIALGLPAGMLLMDPPYYYSPIGTAPETLRAVAIAGELAILTLLSAVTGIVALLLWQSLFPSRLDYHALAGLPLGSARIFIARFLAVLCMAMGPSLLMAFLPAVLAPHQFTAHGPSQVPLFTRFLAGGVASGVACFFVFFAIVAIQGVLINALPGRIFARFSTYVQGALMAIFFFSGLYSWFITDWREPEIARLADVAPWAPPIWFLGLDRVLSGDGTPFFLSMATRALEAAAGAVLAAGLAYLLAYGRYRALLVESRDATPQRRPWKWGLLRFLTRAPRSMAIFQFLTQSLARSRTHRLVLLAAPIPKWSASLDRWSAASGDLHGVSPLIAILRFVCLFGPLAVSFILLAAVRHAFSLPVELMANWLFRITESQGRGEWLSAIDLFVDVVIIAPIHLLTLPVAWAVLGGPIAIRMVVLQWLVSLIAFEVVFRNWERMPLTCSYVPAKRPLVLWFAKWLAVLGVLAPRLSMFIAAMSQMNELFFFFLVVFLAIWLWAHHNRRTSARDDRLFYEDTPDSMLELGLGH